LHCGADGRDCTVYDRRDCTVYDRRDCTVYGEWDCTIKSLKNSAVINVPRNRFRPVKTCEDLFLIQSDLFELDKNYHINCRVEKLPIIKFSDNYKKIKNYLQAFPNGIPNIKNLESLEVNDFRIFTENELECNIHS
jgi:hypothetical protein